MPRPFNGRQIFSLGRAGCTHVSDLLVRENCPLALMESVPVRPGNFVDLHRESCSTSGFHASRVALPAITANVFATRVCRTSVRRKGGSLGSLPSVHGFLHSAGLVRGRHRPDSPKPKPGEMSHGWPSLAGLYRQDNPAWRSRPFHQGIIYISSKAGLHPTFILARRDQFVVQPRRVRSVAGSIHL